MGRYKLNPLEELRLEKKRHKEERAIATQRLSYELQYLNDNWGSMLTKGITSTVKSKFSETIDNISTSSSSSVTPFITKGHSTWMSNPAFHIIMSNLPLIRSVAWKFAKPALITFGAKKLTSIIFGRRSKKRK
ncbi:MAG TPA: hypothetical protein VKY45_02720 [Marinilabiliaceae bacterium]|nr:hypothetical protein [Marinilabiliaceae bacterium]